MSAKRNGVPLEPPTTLALADIERVVSKAATEALARYAASHPLPSAVTVAEAGRMLGVSRSTAFRLAKHGALKRNATGLIPYESVLKALGERK